MIEITEKRERERERERDKGCAFGRERSSWTTRVHLVISACLLILSLALVGVVVEQHQSHAILVEQVRIIRVDLADIREHGSPVSDRRIHDLEVKAGIK